MSATAKILKGTVSIEGQLSRANEAALAKKYAGKTSFNLRRMKLESLSFLGAFEGIRDLSFVNVKVADASALTELGALERLFLNGVTVGAGFGFLSKLAALEELHLLNLRGPLELPSLTDLGALTKFRVWGCKGFSDLSILQEVPNLEELELVDTALEPDDLLPLLGKTSVRFVAAQFKTKKHNDVFSEHLTKFGKTRYREA